MDRVAYIEIAKHNKAVYDLLAQEYENLVTPRLKGNLDRIQLFAQFIPKRATVLDIGCGVGMDISHLRNLGYGASGIEISPKMVKFSKDRNPGAEIIESDFLTYDFAGRQWDAIFTRAFLHLFPKEVAKDVLAKIYALLKPEGVALFSVSSSDTPTEGWRRKTDYKGDALYFKKTWSLDELRASLLKEGFSVVQIDRIVDRIGKPRVIAVAKKSIS